MQLSKAETVVSNQKIRRRKRGEEGKTWLGRWILLTSPQFSQARRSKDVEEGESIPSLSEIGGAGKICLANEKRRQVFSPHKRARRSEFWWVNGGVCITQLDIVVGFILVNILYCNLDFREGKFTFRWLSLFWAAFYIVTRIEDIVATQVPVTWLVRAGKAEEENSP